MGNCIGLESNTTVETGGDSFVDVLFFPDSRLPCKATVAGETCTNKRCKFEHGLETNLLKVIKYLRSATKTMDVCVFSITCDEVGLYWHDGQWNI